MKKLYILLILIGLIAFVGIILIATFSERLPEILKTFGFIILGYIGVITFTYGWMKIRKK